MAYGINIGGLDRQIVLMQPTQTRANAETTTDYSAYATVSAAYKPDNGGEGYAANTRIGTTNATFKIRYMPVTITQQWQIYFEGQTWQIDSVLEGGRKEYLTIKAYYKDNTQ
jgi:SPP1 family predicted phage head-tail adaptor